MIFGIDWDKTITADPEYWALNAALLASRGHGIVIVTGRHANDPVCPSFPVIDIVYAGDEYKRKAAERAGYYVDIWCDDSPGTIEPGRKLEW